MKEYSYTELRRIGEKYYNDKNFCTVVALAVCCQQSFGKAYHTMKRAGRNDKRGAYLWQTHQALEALGYDKKPISGLEGKTMRTIVDHLPKKGYFMVHVRGHVAAIRNGEVIDWSEGRKHRARLVYEIVPKV